MKDSRLQTAALTELTRLCVYEGKSLRGLYLVEVLDLVVLRETFRKTLEIPLPRARLLSSSSSLP